MLVGCAVACAGEPEAVSPHAQNYPPQYVQGQYPQAQGYPPQQPPPAGLPQTAPNGQPWTFPGSNGAVLQPLPVGWTWPGLPQWPQQPGSTPANPTSAPNNGWHPPGATAVGLPDAQGAELANRINAYRQSQGLPPVPRSRALGFVAQAHVRDLEQNHPDSGTCNMHSWSRSSVWTGCCYTPDHAHASCMWQKPRELVGFGGNGYEVATGGGGPMTPAGAVTSWQGSAAHNAVILSQGMWSTKPWRAMGTAVYGSHAVAWFAEESDPTGGY